LCGSKDSALLFSHLIWIQDYQGSFPIQDDGVNHAEASVKLESLPDAVISVIESE
jgi:hypothetical protein